MLDLGPSLKYTTFRAFIFPGSNEMGGEICPSLVELQYLRHLDLSYNNFTKIPKFIGSLTSVICLNLSANPIS